jgi:hypothetical protein
MGGGSAGKGGSGGSGTGTGPCAGICSSPTTFAGPGFSSGNLTTSERCFETMATIQGYNCSNMMARELSVNDVVKDCGNNQSPGAKVNGGYCFHVTAGAPEYASFTTF